MKTILWLFIFSICGTLSSAQMNEGEVIYERVQDWVKIMEKLPFMTAEEIERNRFTWGKRERRGSKYVLTFKNEKSIYTYLEEESEHSYSWKKAKYNIIRNQNSNEAKDQVELLGKTYLIEDKIPRKKWKILNEIKEIQGYLCMKAQTTNIVKGQTIDVWFTDAIPFSGGPEGYGGLPGLILEMNVNDGEVIVTATKVSIEALEGKLPIPKKLKGKKIDFAAFDEKVVKFIAKSIEGKKNPYWRIRY